MSQFFSWRSAVLNSDLQSTTKLVLMVIGTHMNDHGEGAFPSTQTIARLASLSERAVCTHTETAEKAGWLKKELHGYRGQKWRRIDYKIAFPVVDQEEKRTEPDSAPSGKRTERRSAGCQQERTEPNSAPSTKGTEPHAEGTEPHDRKALNDVQSITPYNSPIELSNSSSSLKNISNTRKPASKSTRMTLDWMPPDETVNQLMAAYPGEEQTLNLALINFRTYWRDAGVARSDWGAKFVTSFSNYRGLEIDAESDRHFSKIQKLSADLAGSEYA